MKKNKNELNANEEIIEVKDLQRINQFAEDLLSQNTLNEIVWKVTNNVVSLFQLEDCVLYLLNEGHLIKKAGSYNGKSNNEEVLKFVKTLKIGEGIAGQVALNQKSIIIQDTSLVDDYIVDGQVRLSEMAVPLIHEDQLIGVLDSEHSERNFFNDTHLRIFEKLAALATSKIIQTRHIEKLLTRQLHMDLIYNNSYDLIFLMGVEPNSVFRCLSINQSYLNMIGLTWEETIDKTIDEIWGEEKADFFKINYKQAIESKLPRTYEVVYGHIDPPIIAETTITPIFDAHGICINLSGISRDITKSKQAEETLLESEKRYRTLFENSLDGIYKSTPEGKFVNVNPALVKMLGYNFEQDLLEIDIKTQLYISPQDRLSIVSEGIEQFILKKKDGSVLHIEDHSYYEHNDHGEIIYHHGIMRDITAKIEKQKELEILLKVTEEQNGRLQNFAHIVSHNIRSHSSNMTSLVRFLELSQDEYEKSKLFGMLKTSTEKLEDTIQNLSEIITVNQGMNKSLEQRNLYDEINNVLKVISGDIREKKIAVVIEMPYDIKVNIIPAYLDSILLNILSNAIKYGSIERKSKVLINAKREHNVIILSISDNGIGIDLKKNADKIFGMYETFHDNKDARGFGLYITKNQIEAMNGKIEVESEVGEGTTFKIYFNEKN
jgi:PAS domain S-box-containing protein